MTTKPTAASAAALLDAGAVLPAGAAPSTTTRSTR